MEEVAASPLVNTILGVALLSVLGFLGWFIKLWRDDLRGDRTRSQDLVVTSTKVVEQNTSALDKLSEKIERDGDVTQSLLQKLEMRPCLMGQEEKAALLRTAEQVRATGDG